MISASSLTGMFSAINRDMQVAWPPSYPAPYRREIDVELRTTAAQGNNERLRQLLAQGANPDAADAEERTALFHAAMHGHSATVGILLERAASTDMRDAGGYTPLLHAVQHGHREAADALLRAQANSNAVGDDAMTALMFAAQVADAELIRLLVHYGAVVNGASLPGFHALVFATQDHHPAAMAALTQVNVHVHADHLARNAILGAAQLGYAEFADVLAQAGVRLGAAAGSLPPVAAAALQRHITVAAALRDAGANIDSYLLEAVKQGNAYVANVLLQVGAHLDLRTGDGASLLMIAAGSGHAGVTAALVEAGADIDAVDGMGRTATMYAVAGGNTDLVRELLRAEPQLNAGTRHGVTALLLAAEVGNASVIGMLRRAGAPIDATDHDGFSAMLLAAAGQHMEVIAYLRQVMGVDIDADLLSAVQRGTLVMVQTLISAGADINAATKDGRTAMTHAVERGDPDIIECLAWAAAHPNPAPAGAVMV
ncbi:MAG: ankyrin repeat domain-containing protein [Comamonas sp.]